MENAWTRHFSANAMKGGPVIFAMNPFAPMVVILSM